MDPLPRSAASLSSSRSVSSYASKASGVFRPSREVSWIKGSTAGPLGNVCALLERARGLPSPVLWAADDARERFGRTAGVSESLFVDIRGLVMLSTEC